jgi:hypothetical protein
LPANNKNIGIAFHCFMNICAFGSQQVTEYTG